MNQELKKTLQQESETYKSNISFGVKRFETNLRSAGIMALMVGAGVAVLYMIASNISEKKKKVKKTIVIDGDGQNTQLVSQREPESSSIWVTLIKEQLLLFLLAVLKDKLADYVKTQEPGGLVHKIKDMFSKTSISSSN